MKLVVFAICIILIIPNLTTVSGNEESFFSKKTVLEGNDEGPHYNNIYHMQEWWYFNVYLNGEDTELKNWFVLLSIQLYQNYSGLKLELFNDENESFGGDSFIDIDNATAYGPGVNVFHNKSFEIGRYPNYHIYAEFTQPDNLKITLNLTYKANSKPVWLIKNFGRNRSECIFGYYVIMNCTTTGTISLNNTTYNVSGIGYHDHTWAPMNRKNKNITTSQIPGSSKEKVLIDLLRIWDWLCIHFDNGWDAFIGKIYAKNRNFYSKFVPGSFCLTPNGERYSEIHFFKIEIIDTNQSKIPDLDIPIKVHIKALFLNKFGFEEFMGPFILDIYYEAKNTREDILCGNSSTFVYWVSQGPVYGTARGLGKTISLNGWAVMETTANSLN